MSPDASVEPVAHALEVRRTARYFTLPGSDLPDAVWFVLHGYRQAALRFLRRFVGLASPGRLVVAPEGLSRFYVDPARGRHGPEHRVGASWMTREDRESEIRDSVRYLDTLLSVLREGAARRASRIVVLGFSQGVHTAARWVARGAVRPEALVCWGADLPADLSHDPDDAARRMRATTVHLVHGVEDRTRRPDLDARTEDRLAAMGVEPRRWSHPGGHEIHGPTLLGIARDIAESQENGTLP